MKNSNSDLYQWVLLHLRERLNEADKIFNRMNETVSSGTVVMDLPDDELKKIQELYSKSNFIMKNGMDSIIRELR